MAANHRLLALDVGERRVGVALANSVARLSSPLVTLSNTEDIIDDIKLIIADEGVDMVIVGLPKNLSGEDTAQTKYVREFTDQLKLKVDLPTYFEDEALSSVRAKKTLDDGGKPYKKEEIDSLAACYILDDFMANNPGVISV